MTISEGSKMLKSKRASVLLHVQFPTSYFKISNNVPRCRQRRLTAWIYIVDFPSVSLNTIKRSQSADEIAFTEYKTVYILLTNEREEQTRPWLFFTYIFNVEKASSTVRLMCHNRGRTKNSVPVKTNENNGVNSFHVRVNGFSECRHANLLTRQDMPCDLKMPITVKHLKRLSTLKNNPEWSGKSSIKYLRVFSCVLNVFLQMNTWWTLKLVLLQHFYTHLTFLMSTLG
jgi:hypothetical protein